MSRKRDDAIVEAKVFRSFGERTFIEQNPDVGYDLPCHMFSKWWLQWFWNSELLCHVDYRDAGLSLHFIAAMVEAGDA